MEGAKQNAKKIVYEDNGETKVLRGRILEESDFVYKIECLGTNTLLIIGKRAIIKIADLGADVR